MASDKNVTKAIMTTEVLFQLKSGLGGDSRVGALVGPRAPVGEANVAVSKGPNGDNPKLAGWR